MISDMAILEVEDRDFKRSPADWLQKARRGDTVVIVSPEGPALTLTVGRPKHGSKPDWKGHFDWLRKQPAIQINPVDELRQAAQKVCIIRKSSPPQLRRGAFDAKSTFV